VDKLGRITPAVSAFISINSFVSSILFIFF
jgi:hypothetical protein